MRVYGRILDYMRDGATLIQVTPTIITVKVNDADLVRIPPLRNPEEYADLATYELETRVRNSAFTIIKLILEKDLRFVSLVNVVKNTSEEISIELPPE